MYNFTINTDEIEDYESPYCAQCNSCGDFGCECWGNCIALRCKYGDSLIDAYEDNKRDCSLFYDMLIELGIENGYAIDMDRIKTIANFNVRDFFRFRFFTNFFTIKDLIKDRFEKLKDIEEEI